MTIAIDLSRQAALITGAGAGIGREIARWLARAGASVAVNDRDASRAAAVVTEIADEIGHGIADEIAATGRTAITAVADCRDDAALEAMVAEAGDRLGRLDIAVCNIGMLPAGRSVAAYVDQDGAYWRDLLDQNLVLAALSGRAAARRMLADGRGGVILFVSSAETTRPSPYNAAYAAAKAALNHLTTTMAVELGPAGIRVNAIAPGTTATEAVRAAFSDEHLDAIARSSALGRRVDTDELARLTVFLASDLARCITGQLILADAGAFLSRTRPANLTPSTEQT